MSRIEIECFDNEAEIVGLVIDGRRILTIKFNNAYDGFLSIGAYAVRLIGDECSVDISSIEDGVYQPKLILCDKVIPLPQIKKENGIIMPTEYDLSYLRELSIRERRLCQRIDRLEKKTEEIYKKVFGTKIF